jgi:hypothetical protein
MNNISIASIIAHDNFTIDIQLSNGKNFLFDIKPYLVGEGLKKLRQISFFKQAKFRGEVLYWDDMHDFPLHCMDIPESILQR